MAQLKYYDRATSTWIPILAGAKGETGDTGATGATGPQGLPGTSTVNVTTPITNTGTTADAIIGLNYNNLQYGRNEVINGAFDIWQRGISFSASASYTADRVVVDNGTVTRQFGTAGIPYALRITNASQNPAIRNQIELASVGIPGQFATGTTWTVSFYARTSTSIGSNINFEANFTTSVYNSSVTIATANLGASSTSWTRYTRTFTIGVVPGGTNNSLTLVIYLGSGAYAGSFDITGLQLEAGSVATPFKRNGSSIEQEIASCYRYYYQTPPAPAIDFNYQTDPNGFGASSFINFPVVMRVTPSVAQTFTNFDNATNGGVISPSTLGWVSRGSRSNGSFGYFRYATTFNASAEL